MPDLSNLATPPNHGDVLIVPPPDELLRAARHNHDALAQTDARFLDSTLADCRRVTRERLAKRDDAIVIVIGHQPEFIHPGVWAKHIVACRLAAAAGGCAVNLVVDSDVPKRTTLDVPAVEDGRTRRRSIPVETLHPSRAFEVTRAWTPAQIDAFHRTVRDVMPDRWEQTPMPAFITGVAEARAPRDWVDQMCSGRRAIECAWGIELRDLRVSEVSLGPWLVQLIRDARRFAQTYNDALARYRRARGIRGTRHPMPDLHIGTEDVEAPLWAFRDAGPRRRVFVRNGEDRITVLAQREEIATLRRGDLTGCETVSDLLHACAPWRLRPRALALTMWARLFLADLFVHGIGGAKYDRITDDLIQRYFGVTPPAIACVSATLHVNLPHHGVTASTLQALRRTLRDVQWNPHRHLDGNESVQSLVRRRTDLVRESERLGQREPGNHRARRDTFQAIRDVNHELLMRGQDVLEDRRRAVGEAARHLDENRVALSREYFFGLYDHAALADLLRALPQTHDFGV